MRKLTAKQIDERIINKILARIKSLEKKYSLHYIHSACYGYVQSNLAKRKAQEDIEDAQKRLEEAKKRLNG
jgi:HEPN domain-containing protein